MPPHSPAKHEAASASDGGDSMFSGTIAQSDTQTCVRDSPAVVPGGVAADLATREAAEPEKTAGHITSAAAKGNVEEALQPKAQLVKDKIEPYASMQETPRYASEIRGYLQLQITSFQLNPAGMI